VGGSYRRWWRRGNRGDFHFRPLRACHFAQSRAISCILAHPRSSSLRMCSPRAPRSTRSSAKSRTSSCARAAGRSCRHRHALHAALVPRHATPCTRQGMATPHAPVYVHRPRDACRSDEIPPWIGQKLDAARAPFTHGQASALVRFCRRRAGTCRGWPGRDPPNGVRARAWRWGIIDRKHTKQVGPSIQSILDMRYRPRGVMWRRRQRGARLAPITSVVGTNLDASAVCHPHSATPPVDAHTIVAITR
jgi:hypothetical protein